jgi:hypothetical protein
VLGLAYLTRPANLALAGAMILGLLWTVRPPRALARPLTAFVVCFVLVILPFSLYCAQTRGSPTNWGLSSLYSVFDDDELGDDPFQRDWPTPLEFVVANWEFVSEAVPASSAAYAQYFFLDAEALLLLLPVWPVVLMTLARRRYPRAASVLLLPSLAAFAVYAACWSTFQPRYLLPFMILLLPFAADGLLRARLLSLPLPGVPRVRLLHLAVLGILLVWSPGLLQKHRGEFRFNNDFVTAPRTDFGLRWAGNRSLTQVRDLDETVEWIFANTAPDDVLAHHSPWMSTFFTGRPSTRLPRKVNADNLQRFLTEYQVAYVLLNTSDNRRRFEKPLQGLTRDGVRRTTVAGYPVFDTRALWMGRDNLSASRYPG